MTRFGIHLCLVVFFHLSSSSRVLGDSSKTTEAPVVPRLFTDANDRSPTTPHRLPGYCMGRGIWRFPPRPLGAADAPDSITSDGSLRQSVPSPSPVGPNEPNSIVFDNGRGSISSCPFVQDNHKCTAQHEKETVDRLVYQPPDNCPIHTFQSLRIGQRGSCLAGKRLAFLGDSLVRQLVASIACAVGNYSAIVHTIDQSYMSSKSKVRWARDGYVFENAMKITYCFAGSLFPHPLHQSAKPSDMWRYTDPTADILVLNFAVYHTRKLKPPPSPASLRAKILSYGPEIRKHAKGRVVIMGAPAKHVGVCAKVHADVLRNSSGNHSFQGIEQQDTSAGLTSPNIMDELCRQQNEYLAELAVLNGFDFLNVFPLTVHRADAHVRSTDCTHYCSRGVYRVYVYVYMMS